MAMHELKRTHYEDAGDTTIRHDTRDHRQDMTHYHVPVLQMHQAALHGWGIAVGLQVRQTGPSALTVEEGLAIDAQGRMLALAAQGHRPGQPGQAFVHTTGQLVDVPVGVGLEGLADGDYYLTIALATTFISPGEPVEGRWLPQEQRIVNTPLLRLQSTAGFTPDGTAVILATVTLAGGVVTGLSGADRQLARLSAGAVVVRRGGEGEGDPESGRLSPLAAGGLALEVPEAGDQVVLQRAGEQSFQALTVRAERLRLVDGAEREVLHVDATQATLRLGGAGTAGQLVVQNAAGTEGGRISPLAAGGVALEVPEAGDQVVVQRLGAQTFQALTVRAQSMRLVDATNREILHVDPTQATLRLGGEGAAGQLVVQNAAGTEVLRVNTANGDLRVGGDIGVEGVMRGNLAGGLVGGRGRPLVNLREVLNTLLWGELPGGVEAPVGPEAFIGVGRGTFFDAANGLITTWSSVQTGTPGILAARLPLATPEEGFSTIQQITGASGGFHPTLLDTGEVLIVYQTAGAAPNIVMKRGMLDTLTPSSPVITVTATAAQKRFPFAVAVGGQVLILWHEDPGNTWQFIRYNVANGSFSAALPLTGIVTLAVGELHAAVDSTNTVWVAFRNQSSPSQSANVEISAVAVPPDGLPGQPQLLRSPDGLDQNPFVLVDNDDNVWVFWNAAISAGASRGIWYRRFLRATMAWETAEGTQVPGTTIFQAEQSPSAVTDAEGGIWLFWVRIGPSNGNIWCVRYNPVTQVWGEPRQITGHPEADVNPFVLRGPDGSLWLFWVRRIATQISQLLYRRIFPSI